MVKPIEGLTLEQQAVNFETMRHIEKVRNLINTIVVELLERGKKHDQTKLRSPEVEGFTEATENLATTTFGSPEYEACLKALAPTLEHHYAHTRHHPQSFKNGINDMNLVDLLEMFLDWTASSQRHNDGNIRKSIEVNGKRFNMSDQLIRIFENSVSLIED